MTKIEHIHRYERIIFNKKGKEFYKCNLPGCAHYIQKKLVKGRITLCNRCNAEMIMNSAAMLLSKPHCENCTKSKKESINKLKELAEILESNKLM